MSGLYLDAQDVKEVVENFLEVAVFPRMKSGYFDCKHVAVVVALWNAASGFHGSILLDKEYTVDPTAPRKYPFDRIAYKKGSTASKTGKDPTRSSACSFPRKNTKDTMKDLPIRCGGRCVM